MNQYRCETFETIGGIKKASKYRCETCGFNKPIGENAKYCSKASEISVIFMPEDDSNMYLGCASHSDFQSEREKVLELLRLKYVEFLNHPCPELADKYDHCCDVGWCGLCTLDEVLAELRQAGEPDA